MPERREDLRDGSRWKDDEVGDDFRLTRGLDTLGSSLMGLFSDG